MDSFAGSGTTAHAVLNENKADGGRRKFILVEMMDYAENITAERVIDSYGQGKNVVESTVSPAELEQYHITFKKSPVTFPDCKEAETWN